MPTPRPEPRGIYSVYTPFAELLSSVDGSLGSSEEYVQCMNGYGIDVSGQTASGFGALYMYLYDEQPTSSAVVVDGQPSAEWQAFVGVEQEALDADAACRVDQYVEGWEQLAPTLRDFQRQHAGDLDLLQSRWDKIVMEAEAIGFVS